MGCPCDVNNPASYLSCAGDQVRLLVPQSVMTTFAAQAGASSANYTMCLAMMFLASRRMQYWKVTPGDCGSSGTRVTNTSSIVEQYVGAGLATGAKIDPEPISKGILTGMAAIFAGFTAHHTAAVASEQQILCGVTGAFNYTMGQLESAVSQGAISPQNAAAILDGTFNQLNSDLAPIRKGQNAAWGYTIAMTALKNFAEQIVFPALASLAQGQPPAFAPSLSIPLAPPTLPSYVAPAPNNNPLAVASGYQGASGFIVNPLTGGNGGVGETSSILPFAITPGTVLLIGGVAFVASRI